MTAIVTRPPAAALSSAPVADDVRPLALFITVDTEIWPTSCAGDPAAVRAAMDRCILGRTPGGDYGLPHQLRVLNEHGLKAVFFIEALFADAVGIDWLSEIVGMVHGAGHEVQLHLHPEWLAVTPAQRAATAARRGANVGDYEPDDQTALIRRGLDNLRAAGAADVCAFRAGNYGAGPATPGALARNGVAFDTSYNPTYFATTCRMDTGTLLQQPVAMDGVVEVPITVFEAPPLGLRHLQLGACSDGELAAVIRGAWEAEWRSAVLVSHGFELMNQRRDRADPIMLRRFDRFCRFLADNRATVRTAGFAGAAGRDAVRPAAEPQPPPFVSTTPATLWRYAEQLTRRLYR